MSRIRPLMPSNLLCMTIPSDEPHPSPRTHGLSIPPLLAAIALLALFTAGCQKGEALEASDTASAPIEAERDGASEEGEAVDEKDLPPVEVATLDRGPIEAVLRFSSNLEAEAEVQVFSQAARRIVELKVEEGDRVTADQPLVRLQDDEQRNEVARIESQLAKARREYERQQSLFARELISEQTMNEATYEVEQLEIGLEDARRMLSYTEVRAPIAGTITNRYVNLGDTITVNQHLFDIVDFDSIVARVYVPEKELGRLRLGQKARLFSDSLGSEPRRGEVLRIAPIVDPRSGTVKVTLAIPRNQGLLPGMYIEAELVTDVREEALLVPKRAVVYEDNRAFLYRYLEGSTVERLEVRPLLADRENIEPSGDRLSPGDRVVVAGQAGLKDGARVRLAAGVNPSAQAGDEGGDEGGAPESDSATEDLAPEAGDTQ